MTEVRRPWFHSAVVCLSCDHRWVAVYGDPPLYFECPVCEAVDGVRDEDDDDE